MQANGLGTPSPDRRNPAANSADPDHHDCLDGRRGMCLPLDGVGGTQPRAARLRRRQHNRAFLRWGSSVALSGAIPIRTCGATGRPNRRSAAFRGLGVRRSSLGDITPRISTASAHLLGTSNSGGRSPDYAVARSTEASVVSDHQQRGPQGRCCRIRTVRVPFLDCPGRHRGKHHLAHCMGRLRRSAGHNSYHPARGYPVDARTSVRLLLSALGPTSSKR